MIGPSDLEWWQWLLLALGTGTFGAIFGLIGSRSLEKYNYGAGCMSLLLGIPAGLVAVLCAVIGVIRFVKWVWNG